MKEKINWFRFFVWGVLDWSPSRKIKFYFFSRRTRANCQSSQSILRIPKRLKTLIYFSLAVRWLSNGLSLGINSFSGARSSRSKDQRIYTDHPWKVCIDNLIVDEFMELTPIQREAYKTVNNFRIRLVHCPSKQYYISGIDQRWRVCICKTIE